MDLKELYDNFKFKAGDWIFYATKPKREDDKKGVKYRRAKVLKKYPYFVLIQDEVGYKTTITYTDEVKAG